LPPQTPGTKAWRFGGAKGGGAGVASGTVRRFDDKEGYGYVAPDEGGKDLFVHYTAVRGVVGVRSLEWGERVSYVAALNRHVAVVAHEVRRLG
jgi:CspA family cold shock protein